MISTTDQRTMTILDLPGATPDDVAFPPWLATMRRAAATRFAELGLPARNDEEWRHTSLRSLQSTPLVPAGGTASSLDAGVVNAAALPGLTGPRLVFVDGVLSADLSSLDALPAGLTVLPLSEAAARHETLVREHFGVLADGAREAFTSLNTACLGEGTFVHVARGVDITEPILVLAIATGRAATATHPRLLLIAEESSRASVVEDYVSLGHVPHLTNIVTEIFVGANAHVQHAMAVRETDEAFNISTLKVRQERDSYFASHSALFGGALVRNQVNPVLVGTGGHSLLNGLYLPRGRQHHDSHMRVEHQAPNCESRQYYAGILQDHAHGVFSGRIVVSQIAQKTDAIQQNRNLLLSKDAQANTKPQLEIYADDVKCTHGATVGRLDEDAVFYLRSRGIDDGTARQLMISAFAGEVLEKISQESLREALSEIVETRLRRGIEERDDG
ncbi:MAG: Fe-S cluster assembly protein SufD [Phycisphaerales bacterium]|nr:Fe-S cluster assembly protein SufD [Phycisphaerales bacterium]